MFDRTADPIANVPPYRRIGINEVVPSQRTALEIGREAVQAIDDVFRKPERARQIDHIWEAVRQASEGNG